MSKLDALLERMAAHVGISATYTDAFGNSVETSPETRRAILTALGLGTASEEEAQAGLARLERLRAGPLPAVIPVQAERPARIRLRGSPASAQWRIVEESGQVREGQLSPSASALEIPALPLGYHRLRLGRSEATLIAAPEHCWEPDIQRRGARLWGVTAQIYSLRSNGDFGIGSYEDAAQAAEGVAALGGAFLGLSPAHALFSSDRTKISPYSPSSRLFLETIYIDPMAVDGFAASGARDIFETPEMQERLARLRNAALIDYGEAWALKRPLLEALWTSFQEAVHNSSFDDFRRSGGEDLEAHAVFEALSEWLREQGFADTHAWPEPYRNRQSREVELFRAEQAQRISFHAWLQWLADSQLAQAAEQARAAGLPIGLYRDLAVGADSGGSEIWASPEHYAQGLSIGAPPDPLGPQGQDWGLPPFNPLTLEEQGLAAFRALVSANMRHAGAIRIDHAFQLRRLFLIPVGAPASQGAYVDYPFEAMLAVLRIESHRARCLVIAEDLGTAPEDFSDAIMASGLLSYRVLPFEREASAFRKPKAYPRSALAVLTTHDLPTFSGWWRGLDIDLRQTLGVFDPERAAEERCARAADKREFARALAEEGLSVPPDGEEPPLEGAVRYLARSPSLLMGLQLEDTSGELNQPNLPGRDVGHPNWRRRLPKPVEDIMGAGSLLSKLSVVLAEEGRHLRSHRNALASPPPRATYRLQFNKDFTFDDAARIVPYLARLGISHVYSSPIHTASPGSAHGYDICDHTAINEELGGEAAFRRFSKVLHAHGLKLLLDIVPNHMGIGGHTNGWWLSVLEWGRLSPLSQAFDIDWERPGAKGKLIVPFLGSPYGETLEKGELQLKFDPEEGSFSVWHWEHRFPICPTTYPEILELALAALDDAAAGREMRLLAERFGSLDQPSSPGGPVEEAVPLKRRLAQSAAAFPTIGQAIGHAVTCINGMQGEPESFGILHRLLEKQAYRLAYWRIASSDINYRRFFDINTLAGIRVEDPAIFEKTHALIFRLIEEKLVDGLRIDHIDGLADPAGYTRALQNAVGPGFYVVAEKILEPGETLRPWPIVGTSGYDALNLIDGVLLDTKAKDRMEQIYRDASRVEGSYEALLRQAKAEIVQTSFVSELETLVSDLWAIAQSDHRTRDHAAFALREALVDIVAAFPVYRSYLRQGEPADEDIRLIEETIRTASEASRLPDRTTHDFIAAVLLGRIHVAKERDLHRFRRRFQQLTGPVMAKSLEDTLFYRYARLIALNEVGGDPGRFGCSLDAFHAANAERARDWPHAMIATTTHDTKRGEDARGRLLALSEIPEEWAQALALWQESAAPFLSEVNNAPAPDANDQVMLLQALLGAWPLELLDDGSGDRLSSFRKRMEEYLTKALREAKRQTSWLVPHDAYEAAALKLLRALLAPDNPFMERFHPLARRLSMLGMLNGLSRAILKTTMPGVPDLYQGTELWDFSLVDPDNRRPVDYEARAQALDGAEPLDELMENWQSGSIKQRILSLLLQDRAAHPSLYAEGDYRPLEIRGERGEHLIAFIRGHRDESLATIVPRHWASLATDGSPMPEARTWGDTTIGLPEGRWQNTLTGNDIVIGRDGCRAASLLVPFPFAVLRRSQNGNGES